MQHPVKSILHDAEFTGAMYEASTSDRRVNALAAPGPGDLETSFQEAFYISITITFVDMSDIHQTEEIVSKKSGLKCVLKGS